MKKTLAMALGALLTVGSAAPAFAASQINFSGLYRMYFNNTWNQTTTSSELATHDSYFGNRLELNLAFHATDEVSVYWRMRAPNFQRWGETGSLGAITRFVYGVVEQDWGTVSIGRLADRFGYLGLHNLGWAPGGVETVNTAWQPFDWDRPIDGARWANRWDSGFQLVAQFNRLQSRQTNYSGQGLSDEEFSDLFVLEPAYYWEGGGATLGLQYLRDRVGLTGFTGADEDAEPPASGPGSLRVFYINPSIAHSFGDFSIHFEGKAGWGKADRLPLINSDLSDKVSGYAFYLDFDYNYGPGNVMLAGWWASGGKEGDTKFKGLVDMGTAFQPLIVAHNGYTYWNRAFTSPIMEANKRSGAQGDLSNTDINGMNSSNHWGIVLTGGHSFTDDLTVRYALANLWLNKTKSGAGKNIGFEADLGFTIQLLDNLKFDTAFGYLFAGKALDETTDEGVFNKRSDSYNWFNTLTFSF